MFGFGRKKEPVSNAGTEACGTRPPGDLLGWLEFFSWLVTKTDTRILIQNGTRLWESAIYIYMELVLQHCRYTRCLCNNLGYTVYTYTLEECIHTLLKSTYTLEECMCNPKPTKDCLFKFAAYICIYICIFEHM